MKNSLKIDYKALRQESLKPLFDSLERGFKVLDIDFYLVGAVARDTWFVSSGITATGTKDVDFAVYISSKENFEQLKMYLQEKEEFQTSSQNYFTLFSPEGLQLDLLPFGEVEVEGKKMIPGKGSAQIAINGFREVYETGTDIVEFEDGHTFKVCTLPGIVILKLIAFDDRPEIRQKDIKDIALILKHYFDIESDLIYDDHNDLFDADKDLPYIAARVLGRQIKPIISKSEELTSRVIGILEKEISNPEKSMIGQLMVAGTENSIFDAIELLKELLLGINKN